MILRGVDFVVNGLKIPVVDESHHDAKAIQFPAAAEGIVRPGPCGQLLLVFWAALQPRVSNGAVLMDGFAVAMKFADSGNVELRHEIVVVSVITHGPHKTSGGGFPAGFVANLYKPLHAILVLDVELGGSSAEVFLHKGIRCVRTRRVPFAAGAKRHIT